MHEIISCHYSIQKNWVLEKISNLGNDDNKLSTRTSKLGIQMDEIV